MALPKIKYYIAHNPDFNTPKEPFSPMSEEEYEKFKGYEISKITLTYSEFLARAKKEYEKEPTPFEVRKVACDDDDTEKDIMKKTEDNPDFVRWMYLNKENDDDDE